MSQIKEQSSINTTPENYSSNENKTVIQVRGVGKEYELGEIAKDSIKDSVRNLFVSDKKEKETFWALKNISFDVKEGEVLGIVGKNGAGKSTLLKVLSRITYPTEGKITMDGRVASLLEVGTGFHQELTGRENIYLNGSILGMKRKEIRDKFDEIVAFSGVEKFIDTPVKRYSSGMYVRLAFSVAAHLEPEILIVDEVLAVGDAEFQKKCLGKMKDVAGQGRTVLFVSHNMASVKNLCTRAIVLENGAITHIGGVDESIEYYLNSNNNAIVSEKEWDITSAIGNNKIKILSISIKEIGGREHFHIDSELLLKFKIYLNIEGATLDANINVKNSKDETVFHDGHLIAPDKNSKKGYYTISIKLPSKTLNSDVYTVDLFFGENRKYLLFSQEDIIGFEILFGGNIRHDRKPPGLIYQELNWHINYNE